MHTPLQAASSSSAECSAALGQLLQTVVVAPLDHVAWIRVTGADRVRWLNGMVTNSIQELADGQGCYNFVLNAQGRIQGDLTAFRRSDEVLLQTDRAQLPAILAHLDRYIIMDDVELADISDTLGGLSLAGPAAAKTLQQAGVELPEISPLEMRAVPYAGSSLTLVLEDGVLAPQYQIFADAAVLARLRDSLPCTPGAEAAMEDLRVLEGRPRYGVDLHDRDLPQETGQTRALHFNKGCYLGQEIVERIRSRGSVHRIFSGFTWEGAPPEPGAKLEAESGPAGELTTVRCVRLPGEDGPRQLALGFVRREALERGLELRFAGGAARPSPLPFAV